MPLIAVPTELRERLGSLESDQLVSLFEKVGDEQKDHLFELLEERFHRKIEGEISSLRSEMKEENASLRSEMKEGFIEIQKQITRQSQWMIGLIGFLAIALKVLDLIFK